MFFPIARDDGLPSIALSDGQRRALYGFKTKLDQGIYRTVENPCICGNPSPDRDTVVVEKDRYGLSVQSLLCSRCGIIRSDRVLDHESNKRFYSLEYRAIYSEGHQPGAVFEDQLKRGIRLRRFLSDHAPTAHIRDVFEIGCGAGGIVKAFEGMGTRRRGCDFNRTYLGYARARGIYALHGDFRQHCSCESTDLIILSHVLEHLTDPVSELIDIAARLRPDGFLVIEVPGVFSIGRNYLDPRTYFQNAHVYNFCRNHLELLASHVGLHTVFGDERCRFIVQRPRDWRPPVLSGPVFDPRLEALPRTVHNRLRLYQAAYLSRLNPWIWIRPAVRALDRMGLKEPIKACIQRGAL